MKYYIGQIVRFNNQVQGKVTELIQIKSELVGIYIKWEDRIPGTMHEEDGTTTSWYDSVDLQDSPELIFND